MSPQAPPKYVCYKCRNKIPVEDLDAVFHDQLISFVFAPTEVERYLEAADEAIGQKAELLRILEREAERTEKQRKHVLQLHLDGVTDQDAFVRDHKPLEERWKQLDDQIPQLQGEIDFLKIQRQSGDQILTDAKDLHGRWKDLDREEKRSVNEQITSRITVSDVKSRSTFVISRSLPKYCQKGNATSGIVAADFLCFAWCAFLSRKSSTGNSYSWPANRLVLTEE